MELHPFFQGRIAPLAHLSPEQLFAEPSQLEPFGRPAGDWSVPFGVEVTETSCPGPHGDVPLRVYRSSRSPFEARPALLWLHGGGFAAGSLDWPEAHAVAAELADRAGAVVVSVDYRLVGDGIAYPVPSDDVIAAWTWLQDQASTLGVSAGSWIGGASAGANLAAGAALRLRDTATGGLPAGMLLAYGVFHYPLPASSPAVYDRFHELPHWLRSTPETYSGMFRPYGGPVSHLPDAVVPGNSDLRGLPAAAILISEWDDLRGSSEYLAIQLADAGIPVAQHVAPGMIHGHLNWPPHDSIPEIDASIDFLAEALLKGIPA